MSRPRVPALVDIARPKKSNRNRYIAGGAAIIALAAITLALARLEPAAPSIDGGTLWIDTVRQGTMLRQVRAPGNLVPEQIRYVAAQTAGRVESLLRPPATVTASTVIVELSNPDVQLEALVAQQNLAAAEAQFVALRSNLETVRLNQESAVATARSQLNEAKRNDAVFDALDKKGMSNANERARAHDQAAEMEKRFEIEEARLRIQNNTNGDQLKLQQQQIQRLRAIAQFQENRVLSMKVPAGENGVLQTLPLELGQWVVPGTVLGTVAQPGKLKAVLRIPETQAKDVAMGQRVEVDTRNGIIPGHVIRIDPGAQGGTVAVDVALDGALPRGARPELSVDGTIEIERLSNVLYVSRPAYGQAESVVGLFRVDPDGKTARRVNVKLGRSSANTIEIVSGLKPRDHVIVSDMTQWDNVDRVKLR